MSTKFITAILTVGALIATLSAAPAQAGNDNLARTIDAAARLYILNQAIENGTVQKVHDRGHDQRGRGHGWKDQGWKGHDGKQRWARPALPRHCVRQVGGRHKSWYALSSHCLDRNYPAALPRSCETRAWYKGKARSVYSIGCLKGRGYDLARR